MTDVAVQRRPRNRKQLIVAAAAKQCERRGFHDAAIADIAADVGITGPALYRHFRGKQNLLAAAVVRDRGARGGLRCPAAGASGPARVCFRCATIRPIGLSDARR